MLMVVSGRTEFVDENVELSELLLSAGACPNGWSTPEHASIPEVGKYSPIRRAISNSNYALVRLLLSNGAKLDGCMDEAIQNYRDFGMMLFFFDNGYLTADSIVSVYNIEPAIFYAARNSMPHFIRVLELLLDRNANPNVLSEMRFKSFGREALHVIGPGTALCMAVEHQNAHGMRLLLKSKKAEVNPAGVMFSPLWIAVKKGNVECTDELLEAGADAEVVEVGGRCLLQFAIEILLHGVRQNVLYYDDDTHRYHDVINLLVWKARVDTTHVQAWRELPHNEAVYADNIWGRIINDGITSNACIPILK